MVMLALNPFLNSVAGESVVLISNNATVVAYLRKQWCSVSKVLCNLA